MNKTTQTESGASAVWTKKWKCLNCKETFTIEQDAHEHWAKTCRYGGYLAPINDIIVEMRVKGSVTA